MRVRGDGLVMVMREWEVLLWRETYPGKGRTLYDGGLGGAGRGGFYSADIFRYRSHRSSSAMRISSPRNGGARSQWNCC